MPTGTYAPEPFSQHFDTNGNPLNGGKIETYIAGTSTPVATYSDVLLTTPNANPVILDSAGFPTSGAIFLTPGVSYKFILKTSAGVTIATRDNIAAVPISAGSVDVTGTAGESLTAGQAVYLSDGSGSKTQGQWYKADNSNPYSSSLPSVGMVAANITSGASGTIRIQGQITGLSSLTVGANYYVSTAGAITATEPTDNRRLLGRADSTTSLVLYPNPPTPPVEIGQANGRLTLTSGTAVTIADVTAATTIFFTPYQGNRIAVYDGANWSVRTFSELSIAVPATTQQMYDVFIFDNAGTLALELNAWVSDVSRSAAIVLQNGVYVKSSADKTRRYLGSFRTTTVSGQTEDSAVKRYVWNFYNRVPRTMIRLETTDSWNYTTNTWRQAQAVAANQLDFVIGVPEVQADVRVHVPLVNSTGNIQAYVGIGFDSTTTPSANCIGMVVNAISSAARVVAIASLIHYPAAGRHVYVWLEKSDAVGTTTWYGDNGATGDTQGGIIGWIVG